MAIQPAYSRASLTETIMRFAPAAAALALAFAVTTSVGHGAEREPSPRAAILIAQGDVALEAGDTQGAIDAYEAALTIDPSYTPLFLSLATAARSDGLQGKAIRYYREALTRDPGNLAAISGEGEALLEKGAVEKARLNLAKLESLCGEKCDETKLLAAAIAAGPKETVLTAEAVMPDTQVSTN